MDDLLVFNTVFGKTVPDISLNAIANLGYAECVFSTPVYAGDTLSASSEVIGLKENSNGKTGTVYVRSKGVNQRGEDVLSFVRWVMVRKRQEKSKPSCGCCAAASKSCQHQGWHAAPEFNEMGFCPVRFGAAF